ncbi:MAG: hypothetical protein NZM11_08815 [Anaerolineales bacterium]|nr:hypothetical protein [Anaerolineales bacterium]
MDTTTMNLPTQGFCFLANRMIKEEFGLPVGECIGQRLVHKKVLR